MRYYELFENRLPNIVIEKTPNLSVIDEITNIIINNCSKYLELVNGKFFYRGMPNHNKIMILDVNNNRKAYDSHPKTHETFNYLIRKNGKTANRSNSIFVTGDRDTAESYGNVYYIFPIGNFHYTWLQGVSDWFATYDVGYVSPGIKSGPLWMFVSLKKEEEQIKKKYYNQYKSYLEKAKNNDIKLQYLRSEINNMIEQELIQREKEIKKEFYADPDAMLSKVSFGDITQEILDYFKENLKGDDGTLIEAYNSGNEVMISCDQYIAINWTIFRHFSKLKEYK